MTRAALALALALGVACAAPAAALASPGARAVQIVAAEPGFRLPVERIEFEARETARCLRCHGMPNFMVRDSLSGEVLRLSVGEGAFRRSAHGGMDCTQCHRDIRSYPHEFKGPRPHVGCDADCHARDTLGRPVRHDTEVADFRRSAHRGGLDGTDPASPTCGDCHGAGDLHAIDFAKGKRTRLEKMTLCADCHEDRERLAGSEADLAAVPSYRGSFHYKAIRLGSTRAAVCQDCHGVHRVIAASDTSSTVNATHLQATCGQRDCHEGDPPNFALSGANHLDLRVRRDPALAATALFFLLIGGTALVALATGAALDAQRRFARDARGAPRLEGPLVQRMSLAQRLQHGGLVACFVVLALTGLPLRFPDAAPLARLYALLGGLEVARVLHRAAAAGMVLVALAHAGYALGLLARARFDVRRAWTMLPAAGDARDAWQTLRFDVRRRPDAPPLGRHHFREKLHYFAVLFGLPVMTVSGLILWFPVVLGGVLPDAAIGMAVIAHGDEALVAIAIVVVWHLYQVHLAPWPYHRFAAWLDGRIHYGEWVTHHGRDANDPPR